MAKKREKVTPKREPKHVILFFVEGESDKIALEDPISRFIKLCYPEERVDVGFCIRNGDLEGGDITADLRISTERIRQRLVRDFYMPYQEKYKCMPKDLKGIIQIVDMDGAFLKDSDIIKFSDSTVGREKTYYDEESGKIVCVNPVAIAERNRHKREILASLVNMESLTVGSKRIPYSIFFFSSNLDHFLHMNANVEYGKKGLAEAFVRNYENDLPGFCKFFCEDEDASPCAFYLDSWEYIMERDRSIKRGTNLNILINQIEDRKLAQPMAKQNKWDGGESSGEQKNSSGAH